MKVLLVGLLFVSLLMFGCTSKQTDQNKQTFICPDGTEVLNKVDCQVHGSSSSPTTTPAPTPTPSLAVITAPTTTPISTITPQETKIPVTPLNPSWSFEQKLAFVVNQFDEAESYFKQKRYSEAKNVLSNVRVNLVDLKTQDFGELNSLRENFILALDKKAQFQTHNITSWELYLDGFTNLKKFQESRTELQLAVQNLGDYYNLMTTLRPSESALKETLQEYNTLKSDLTFRFDETRTEFAFIGAYASKIDPESVRPLAAKILENKQTDKEKAEALYKYVRDSTHYLSDPRINEIDVDYVQSPAYTVQISAGDCDDHMVLLNSLFEAAGLSSSVCFGKTNSTQNPLNLFEADHAFSAVTIDNQMVIADAVCKGYPLGQSCFNTMSYKCIDYANVKLSLSYVDLMKS